MTAGSPRLFQVTQEQLTSDDYYTPPWVFERMALSFDLDVAAPTSGVEWVPAARYYDQAADGLTQPWEGRVWMNPPYSHITPWVRRFIEHANGIALLPHAQAIWHSDLWNTADAWHSPRRFRFVTSHRQGDGRPFLPVFFAAFGDECVEGIGRLGVVRRIA